MDPLRNPYTPNAGATPAVVVGRDDQVQLFELLLARLEKGRTEQSLIVTGLRGVGKTVLLREFQKRASNRGWAIVDLEISKHDDAYFRRQIGQTVRQALLSISPRARWGERGKRAAAVLRSFTLTVDANGQLLARRFACNEPRGVGGIFYDYITPSLEQGGFAWRAIGDGRYRRRVSLIFRPGIEDRFRRRPGAATDARSLYLCLRLSVPLHGGGVSR